MQGPHGLLHYSTAITAAEPQKLGNNSKAGRQRRCLPKVMRRAVAALAPALLLILVSRYQDPGNAVAATAANMHGTRGIPHLCSMRQGMEGARLRIPLPGPTEPPCRKRHSTTAAGSWTYQPSTLATKPPLQGSPVGHLPLRRIRRVSAVEERMAAFPQRSRERALP